MVSLDRFETFRAVVDCGSLSAAADTLGEGWRSFLSISIIVDSADSARRKPIASAAALPSLSCR